MAQREGSVYLYLFIVAVVLFFVMAIAFFFENAAKNELAGQFEAQRATTQNLTGSNKDLSDELAALRGLVSGTKYSEDENEGTTAFIASIRENELSKLQKTINDALGELEELPRSYDNLIAPYDDLQSLLQNLREARKEALQARDVASNELAEATKSSENTVTELRSKYNEALDRIRELDASNADIDSSYKAEKAGWVRRIDDLRSDLADQKITFERERDFERNKLSSVQRRLDGILSEVEKSRSFENVEPDGQLQEVLGVSNKGWINLGRRDHIHKGLPFRVFQYVKGGKKEYKGRVEVIKVADRVSEVRILEEGDSLNPITAGDFITSPFYDPDENPVFVFAGSQLSTSAVSRQTLEARMAYFGAVIQDKVDLDTDFVVALEGYEASTEFAAAKQLGVTIIRDRELLEFVGR
jgi:NAD-dependent DNA ligase